MSRKRKVKDTEPRKGQRHFATFRPGRHDDKSKHTRKVKHKKGPHRDPSFFCIVPNLYRAFSEV